MPEYFRRPLPENQQTAAVATYPTNVDDQRKIGRKLRRLDVIFAKARLNADDLATFTQITGLAFRGDDIPKDGPSLREIFKGGTCIRTRISMID